MIKEQALFTTGILMLAALLVQPVAVGAADDSHKEAATGIELICLTEQPAIVEGESVTLKAWVTTTEGQPINFSWEADTGRIETQAPATRWDLSAVKIGQQAVRKVIATVKAMQPGRNELRCTVEVLIGKKEATDSDRSALKRENLLSARRFLLPGEVEAPGYGLYSYLLFSAPPKDDEEKARYLKTIEAYLLVLQDVDEYLRRHVRPRSLNATYIPLRKVPSRGKSNTEWAVNVLAVYDYSAAQILLSRVQQAYQKKDLI